MGGFYIFTQIRKGFCRRFEAFFAADSQIENNLRICSSLTLALAADSLIEK